MNWEILPFEKVLADRTGGNKKIKTSDYLEDGILPIIDQGIKMISGYTNDTSKAFNYTKPVIAFGDHTCIFKFIDYPFALGADGIKILEPIIEISAKYLYYFFHTIKIPNTGYDRHFKYLKRIKIPVPPPESQQKIAAILDAADAVRQKNRLILQKYDELAQSVFLEMFGDPDINSRNWRKEKFERILTISQGLVNPLKSPYDEMYHVGGDNITSESGEIISLKKAKDLNLVSGKFIFTNKHILYNKIRPYLNKVAKPEFTGICSADMYPIEPKSDLINRDFLFFVFRSKSFLKYAEQQSRRANIPKINRQEIYNYHSIVPPIEIQKVFSEKIAKIELSKELTKKLLNHSEYLFQSIIQKAFKGELFEN